MGELFIGNNNKVNALAYQIQYILWWWIVTPCTLKNQQIFFFDNKQKNNDLFKKKLSPVLKLLLVTKKISKDLCNYNAYVYIYM